jgi:hypothetical protein
VARRDRICRSSAWRAAWRPLHDQEREAVRGGESLSLLGDVVVALLEQRKFAALRDVIGALQGKDGEAAVSDATLEHVIHRLCTERAVRISVSFSSRVRRVPTTSRPCAPS